MWCAHLRINVVLRIANDAVKKLIFAKIDFNLNCNLVITLIRTMFISDPVLYSFSLIDCGFMLFLLIYFVKFYFF